MTTTNTKQRDRTFDKFFRKVDWENFHVDVWGKIRMNNPTPYNVCPLAYVLGNTWSLNVVDPAVERKIVPHWDAAQHIIAAADNMTDNSYYLPQLRKRMIKNIERSRKNG